MHTRFSRLAIAVAFVGLPLVGTTVVTSASAQATTTHITCKVVTGTVDLSTGVIKENYSKCSGNTGKKGKSTTTTSATTATIKWANTDTTKVSVEAAEGSFTCASGDIAEAISGKVLTDTTGSATVGGAVSESVCYDPTTGTPSLAAGTVAKI
jgi:hypothetical protein